MKIYGQRTRLPQKTPLPRSPVMMADGEVDVHSPDRGQGTLSMRPQDTNLIDVGDDFDILVPASCALALSGAGKQPFTGEGIRELRWNPLGAPQ